MGMFTNFSKTTRPDNRFEFLPKEKVDEIIIGASCKHVFKIPFAYSSIVESGVAIYSQGVDTSFAIEITKDMVHENYDESVIIVKLPVSKTLLFSEDKAGNSTKCQLKLLLKTGETSYDKPYKLKVFKPLDIHAIADNDLGIHLLAVNVEGEDNKVRIQMLDKEGLVLEETQDIWIGGGGSRGTTLTNVSIVEHDDKKQLRFEFTDSDDLYCDINEIYSKINAKQDKISDLDTIRSNSAKALSAVQPEQLEAALGGKQDRLVSGENIKTINGNDITGSGNIEIKGGGDLDPEDLDRYLNYGVFKVNGERRSGEVVLEAGRVYEISGYLKSGHILINGPIDNGLNTQLIFNSAFIKSDREQAIYSNQTKKKVVLTIKKDATVEVYSKDEGFSPDENSYGVIQADGNLAIITGENSRLHVHTDINKEHAIRGSRLYLSGAGLVEVESGHDGLHGGKLLRIDSGNYRINKAKVDGIEAGLVEIFGGNIEILDCSDAAISSKETKGIICGYDTMIKKRAYDNISNIDVLDTVPFDYADKKTLQEHFGQPIIKEGTQKPIGDFPTPEELAKYTDVNVVDGCYRTAKQYVYTKGYIDKKIIFSVEKAKWFADDTCVNTNLDASVEYVPAGKKLEGKAKEDAILMVINSGAGAAVKSNSSVGLQENGNYIFKANSGKAVNNVNYLFTKGDGIKQFLTEGDVTIKAARLTLGADHGEIIEDRKDTLFEIGSVYVNNKIILEPSSYSYCDGKMYYAYGQVGLVMTNGCDAEGIEHFWTDGLDVITTADSAMIIDKSDQAQYATDSYTKAEADARFTLISLYEAKIAELEKRIRALENGQTIAEPTAEPSIDETGKVTLNNVSIVDGQIDLGSKADLSESGSVIFK